MLNKVLNVMDPGALAEKAEAIFHTPVAEALPLSEEIVQLGSGGVFSLLDPSHPYSRGVVRLADIVAEQPSKTGN